MDECLKRMNLFQIRRASRPFPEEPHLLPEFDYDEIADFFHLKNASSGQLFFSRYFILQLTKCLNHPSLIEVLQRLNILVIFDKLEKTETMLCRFHLPTEEGMKRLAFNILLNIYLSNKTWIEKIIFDEAYFIMFSYTIK